MDEMTWKVDPMRIHLNLFKLQLIGEKMVFDVSEGTYFEFVNTRYSRRCLEEWGVQLSTV